MDFDQTKKIEVEVTENNLVENNVGKTGKRRKRSLPDAVKGWDALDIALVPVIVGIFVSLGFLFAGLFKATAAAEAANQAANIIAAMF